MLISSQKFCHNPDIDPFHYRRIANYYPYILNKSPMRVYTLLDDLSLVADLVVEHWVVVRVMVWMVEELVEEPLVVVVEVGEDVVVEGRKVNFEVVFDSLAAGALLVVAVALVAVRMSAWVLLRVLVVGSDVKEHHN